MPRDSMCQTMFNNYSILAVDITSSAFHVEILKSDLNHDNERLHIEAVLKQNIR